MPSMPKSLPRAEADAEVPEPDSEPVDRTTIPEEAQSRLPTRRHRGSDRGH